MCHDEVRDECWDVESTSCPRCSQKRKVDFAIPDARFSDVLFAFNCELVFGSPSLVVSKPAPELVLMYMILLMILLNMFIIVTIPEAVVWH